MYSVPDSTWSGHYLLSSLHSSRNSHFQSMPTRFISDCFLHVELAISPRRNVGLPFSGFPECELSSDRGSTPPAQPPQDGMLRSPGSQSLAEPFGRTPQSTNGWTDETRPVPSGTAAWCVRILQGRQISRNPPAQSPLLATCLCQAAQRAPTNICRFYCLLIVLSRARPGQGQRGQTACREPQP